MLVCAVSARAQAAQPRTGALAGTVIDETGGVVVGASLELTGDRSERQTTLTNAEGRYTFTGLDAGAYSLTVNAQGFMLFGRPVTVRTDRTTTLDVRLRVGISLSVDVKQPNGLSTDPRRNLSAVTLTGRDLDALPDDPQQMLRRLLQMAGSTGRPGDVAVYVDGFREYKRLPPKAVIDMIRINSNPFSAEFSQPSARRIEIVTKPGADSPHGDIRLQARSGRFDARNPLATTRPDSEYRNVNGYLQGPLRKERAGFLLYGGAWRQDDNAVIHATTLTPDNEGVQTISTTLPTPTTVYSAMGKVDVKLFGQLLNASFTRTAERHHNLGLDSGLELPEFAYTEQRTDNTSRLWWTTVGGRGVNDVRIEVSRSSAAASPRTAAPAVVVLDAFSAGGQPSADYRNVTTGVQASDSYTWLRGRHTFKVGGDLERTRLVADDRSGYAGTYTFGADVARDAQGAPLLDAAGATQPIAPLDTYRRTRLGLPGYGPSQFSIVAGATSADVTQLRAGWFALDDWSPSNRWSLSYGLRQDVQNNVRVRPSLEPRMSVSWLLDRKAVNALKFGAGLFNTAVEPGMTLDTRRFDGVHRTQLIVDHPSFFGTVPPSLDVAAPASSSVYTRAADMVSPRTFVSTTSFERQWPHEIFGTVQYTFAAGRHLLRLRSLPREATTDGAVAPLLQFESSGRSQQHELLIGLRADISEHLSVTTNYRLARLESDTDGPYTMPADSGDLRAEYGAAAEDRRHQLTLASTVGAFGLWFNPSVSVSSGAPFNITTGRDTNGDGFFIDRPSWARPGDPGAVTTAFGTFNPNPAPGDAIIPRNLGREPWQTVVDLSISRTVSRVTITGDAQNLLNADRYSRFNGVVTSPTFGQPTRALGARRLELTLRYGF